MVDDHAQIGLGELVSREQPRALVRLRGIARVVHQYVLRVHLEISAVNLRGQPVRARARVRVRIRVGIGAGAGVGVGLGLGSG